MQLIVHKELVRLKQKYYQLLSLLSVEELTLNQRLRPLVEEVDGLLKRSIKKSMNHHLSRRER